MKISSWEMFSDSLIRNGKYFEVEKSTAQMKFKTERGNFEYIDRGKGAIPMNELYFIGMVKKHTDQLKLNFEVEREKIKYFSIPRHRENIFIDCFEVDLSAAYWNFAYSEGLLSRELYERGKTVSKRTRLASLGAIAKITTHLIFDGKKWLTPKITEAPNANYFFHVANRIGELMQILESLAFQDFLFFWCDAIFIKPESLSTILDYLEMNNIGCSCFLVDKIEYKINEGFISVISEQWKKKKEENSPERVFYFKKEDKDLFEKTQLKNKHYKGTKAPDEEIIPF